MRWFFRSKWFIGSVIVAIILVISIISIILFTNKPAFLTVRAIGGSDSEQRMVSDYKGSQLFLNKNGTFIFKIVYNDSPEFMGQGTYTKSGKTYTFKYNDMYRDINGQYEQDNSYINKTFTYKVVKSRIVLTTPDESLEYYFK